MRKQLLGLILPLLVLALIAAAADTPGQGTAVTAALQRLEVARSPEGLRVEFTAKGGVIAPKVTTLDSPARIVIDLPNTVMATGQNRINVGSEGVKAVRIGMDGQNPPTTRVVVDLAAAMQHELVAGADGHFTLKIQSGALAQHQTVAASPTPKLVLASAPVTASVPASPAPAELQPAPKAEAASTAVEKSAKPANDFVFVEPTYAAKNDQTAPTVEPAELAAGAAARFADKTAAELVATKAHSDMQDSGSPQAIQPAVNLAAEQKAQLAQKQANNGPKYTGEPISVNLKDVDLKDFFRLIHEISGLNVVLDPNVKGTLTIVLDDVPWDQALDIVLKNNSLTRQLDGNVLRVATVETLKKEADNRRAQVESEALAVERVTMTRFLSYAHSKDVVPALKGFLSKRGTVVADERTNALIICDIPAVLPPIDRLIQQMDRKTQEVEIEARVVAATRSFARDIGTQLGFGWGNGPSAVGGVQGVGITPTMIGNTPNPLYIVSGNGSGGVQIPLFSNLGVTSPTSGLQFVNASNNMRLDVILTMAESRGLLKILSRPRVVTQNNIQAVVKQGVRVPIVTQAQLGGPPTVTYVDAFLRLTVTPQITSEGTIFLNVDVENTVPDFGHTVQGNPTLVTQQATTQVLVTDGGTVVIGGVIQTQNSVNVSQVPLLGDIPYLGNLFKRRTVSTANQELIFFITPRIIQT
jgi:type IV pilus secretin PilQ/predicted competence protein